MRGTLSASEMVAKERTPSENRVSWSYKRSSETLTHCGNDLRLETKLVAEATSEVVEAALSISRNIWRLPDVVEHVPTGEKQHTE